MIAYQTTLIPFLPKHSFMKLRTRSKMKLEDSILRSARKKILIFLS